MHAQMQRQYTARARARSIWTKLLADRALHRMPESIVEERGLTAFARLRNRGPSLADRHVSASRIDTTSSVGAAHASDMRAHIDSIASDPRTRYEAHSQPRNEKSAQQ
jgi:hypothetical protein